MDDGNFDDITCPVPHPLPDKITMAHGGGGTAMQRLIEGCFAKHLDTQHHQDAAVLHADTCDLAFSTDSFVVQPLFFPGGNIGSLAVHGTVNDLAMQGARPRWLSAGYILEEGFPIAGLDRIVQSMGEAARACGVQVVTGDTKVIEHGSGSGVMINTSGVGTLDAKLQMGHQHIQPGDAVLINGDLGRHGMAIMSVRAGLAFESEIRSDSAALVAPVHALLDAGIRVRCMRDLTRGGLASATNEVCASARRDMRLRAVAVPVTESVKSACEVLGLDPLYVANEGRFMAIVAAEDVDAALEILGAHSVDCTPAHIGSINDGTAGQVILETPLGTEVILDQLSGDQLPRIC